MPSGARINQHERKPITTTKREAEMQDTQMMPRRSVTAKRVGRRGVLALFGGAGLTAATAMFGKSEPAYAICQKECCSLLVCPNTTMASCRNGADYVWTCAPSSTRGCSCCEKVVSGKQYSAYSCTSCFTSAATGTSSASC